MTPYGKFLADDESWNGSGDVFLARQRGHQGEPNAVLKVFPRIIGRTAEATARQIELRGAAFQLQHEASRNQERFVAPILEDKITPDGVPWLVSRRYATSAEAFIRQLNGRPAPVAALWHICFSVASGALAIRHASKDVLGERTKDVAKAQAKVAAAQAELKAAQDKPGASPDGIADAQSKLTAAQNMAAAAQRAAASCAERSHGNLKPTRILLAHPNGLPDAEVVVTQPEPGDASCGNEFELRDLEDIGRLIFQLVAGKCVASEAEWAEAARAMAKPSKVWKSLGARHAAWSTLCRELLAVRENRGALTLARLEERLRAMKPEPEGSGPGLRGGLLLALVAIGGGLGLWWKLRPKVEQRDPWLVLSDPPGADVAYLAGPTNAPVEIGRASPAIQTNGPQRIVVARFLDPNSSYARLREQRLTNEIVPGRGITNQFQFPFGTASLGLTNSFARVRIVNDPRDSTVVHEGPVTANPSDTRLILNPGRYLAEFSAPGSSSRNVPFTLTNGQDFVIVTNLTILKPGTFEVTLDSTIPNAIFLEGTTRLARFSVFAQKTAHTLTLRAPAPWGDLQTNLVLTANGIEGRTNTVFFIDPPRGEIRFDLSAEGGPARADVWITAPQRAQAGGITTTESSFQWPPGTFNVEIAAEGYRSTNFTVTVTAGTNVAYPVYLEPLYGTFTATANLEGAILFTNGVLAGPINKSLKVLLSPNRDHVLTAVFTNDFGELDPVSTSANLKPAEQTNTTFQFQFATVDLQPELTNTIVTVAGRTAPLASLRRYHRPSTPLSYSAVAEHYLPATNTVAGLAAGSSLAVPIRLQPRLYPVLTRVGPVDALLTNVATRTPWATGITNVRWGTYTLSLSHPDHPELGTDIQTLVTTTNSTAEQTLWLSHGRVDVVTGQPGLLVKLDGVELKGVTTPLRGRLMKPGVHELTFALRSFEGKSVMTKSITVNEIPRGNVGAPPQTFQFSDVRFLPTEYVTQGGLKLLLVEDFLVGEMEVTRAQFNQVLAGPASNDALPARTATGDENLRANWANAMQFCERLTQSERSRLDQQLGAEWRFALPTPAEWLIFAAQSKGGVQGANINGALLEGRRPQAVRNSYGLIDVYGNVMEWLDNNGTAWVAGAAFDSGDLQIAPPGLPPEAGLDKDGGENIGFRIVLRRRAP